MDAIAAVCSFAMFLVVAAAIGTLLVGGAVAAARRKERIDTTLTELAGRLGWSGPQERGIGGDLKGRDVRVTAISEGIGRHRKRYTVLQLAVPHAELVLGPEGFFERGLVVGDPAFDGKVRIGGAAHAVPRLTHRVRAAWLAMANAGNLVLDGGQLTLRAAGWEHAVDTLEQALNRLRQLADVLDREGPAPPLLADPVLGVRLVASEQVPGVFEGMQGLTTKALAAEDAAYREAGARLATRLQRTDLLLGLLQDPADAVVRAAIDGLGQTATVDAVAALQQARLDARDAIRAIQGRATGERGGLAVAEVAAEVGALSEEPGSGTPLA